MCKNEGTESPDYENHEVPGTQGVPDRVEDQSLIDKWKLQLDLDLRNWTNFYHNLPDTTRDKGYRLITLYTATLAAFPTFYKQILSTASHWWNVSEHLGVYFLVLSLLAVIICYITALINIIKSAIITKGFHTFTVSELQKFVPDTSCDTPMMYAIISQHLQDATTINDVQHKEMLAFLKRSLNFFFAAVTVGFLTYTICETDSFFSNNGKSTNTKAESNASATGATSGAEGTDHVNGVR